MAFGLRPHSGDELIRRAHKWLAPKRTCDLEPFFVVRESYAHHTSGTREPGGRDGGDPVPSWPDHHDPRAFTRTADVYGPVERVRERLGPGAETWVEPRGYWVEDRVGSKLQQLRVATVQAGTFSNREQADPATLTPGVDLGTEPVAISATATGAIGSLAREVLLQGHSVANGDPPLRAKAVLQA